MTKFPPRRPRAVAAGLAFAAVVALGFPLLAAEPAAPTETAPAAAPEAEPSADAAARRRATETPGETRLNDALAVEVERRFNDLRRELLDDRARTVGWWLAAMAIVLTLFGVVAVVAGYLGFKRFREIEAEARGNVEAARTHAEEAGNLVDEIRGKAKLLEGMTAETAVAEPGEADEAARSTQADPAASLIDRSVADAILLQRQGNIEEAIEKWRAIANVADRIDNELGARAWFSVGYLLQKNKPNDPESAIAAYDEAVWLNPNLAEAYNNRGNAKAHLDRHEDAIADHDKTIRLKPDYAEAYNNRGSAKYDLGRHEDAIADYDEAIRLKPDLAEAYNNRGSAKHNLGRREDAIADCDEAIRLKPDYATAYINRGNAKRALGRHENAIADYDEAVRLEPDLAGAYYNRGSAKYDLGRHEDAIADYDEAIRLKPDYAEAYNNRGNAKAHLGRHEDAIADYDEAVRLKPDDATTYSNRGNAKRALGRHENAIADHNEAIRLKPDNAVAYNNRAATNLALGHEDEARRDLETALALARAAGDETTADAANRALEQLSGGGDP